MESFATKKCFTCGKSISGRLDKKFCGDQCRATYNNRNKKPNEVAMQRINSQLRKNRTILKTLCPTGKATVRKEVLSAMGFSFRHFTSMFGNHPKSYFLCYDYAFMPMMERSASEGVSVQKVLIVQQQDYMKNFDPWVFSN